MDSIGIDISERRWMVAHLRGGLFKSAPPAHLEIVGDAGERAERLKAYVKEKRLGSVTVALAFPPKDCLFKVLSLPSTGPKAISKMLGFEMERHLPSDAQDWLWSYMPLKTEGATAIMLSAVRAAHAEATLSILKAAGITPALMTSGQAALAGAATHSGFVPHEGLSAVASAGEECFILQVFRDGVLQYSSQSGVRTVRQALSFALSYVKEAPATFLIIDEGLSDDGAAVMLDEAKAVCGQVRIFGPVPALSRAFGAALMALEKNGASGMPEPGAQSLSRKKAMAAAASGVLAMVAAGGAVAVNDILAIKRVEREVASLGEDRVRAEALLRDVEAMTRDLKTLEEIKGASSPGFLDTLRRLTEITPEDTYLTGLEYGKDTMTVDGVSLRASGLFMNLSRSGFAEEINYDGPVMRGQDGKERFRIKFRNSGGHGDEETRLGS